MKYMIILILFILCSIVYGGTIDPNISDSHYINYGSKFECVVNLCGTYDEDQPYCASGVAIKPHWVLTAAHVIKEAKTCRIGIKNRKIKVNKIIPHKDFEKYVFGYYDIGLVHCEEDLEVAYYPELYKQNNEDGKICAIAGYGMTGNFIIGAQISDNKKRAGSNIIEYIDKHLLICTLNNQHTPMEFLIASGDSGGGLFIDKKLAGINSCVLTDDGQTNSNINDESGHTRVSQHIEWIENTINENEKK